MKRARDKRDGPLEPLESSAVVAESVSGLLGDTLEQQNVVGPLVSHLCDLGWSLDQMVFGKTEWRVPRNPSAHTMRERGRPYGGFPVDLAVFDESTNRGDPRHLIFLVECKRPDDMSGAAQLETYLQSEPHARLGILVNCVEPRSRCMFVFRQPNGSLLTRQRRIEDLPRPGDAIRLDSQRFTFSDLVTPTEDVFRRTIDDLLDRVVINDANVTRREDQLDQLCNLLLLKLESDKQAKVNGAAHVSFRQLENAERTATAVRERYEKFVALYPETFVSETDRTLRFNSDTLAECVGVLAGLRLIDQSVTAVAVAFQALRSEALKQGEGQYFTPQAIIEAGVRLLDIQWEDIVLDPACGTGGFLTQTMIDMQRSNPDISGTDLTRWAQTHIFGIEKDAIGLKLTKAMMQIAGDGSAHCVRGDSIRTHNWARDWPHLQQRLWANERFTKILTNPPFGKNLKVSAKDCRLSQLEISRRGGDTFSDMEIGLLFLQRAYDWLRRGGRLGIVLPETYFFSTTYSFVFDWMESRLRPVVVANVPMEAFQGFCRAKTNFYVFEKIG